MGPFFSNIIEILYKKVVKTQEFCDLKAFVELLYEVHKIKKSKDDNKFKENMKNRLKNQEKENTELSSPLIKSPKIEKEKKITKNLTKDQLFKQFLDDNIVPKYKSLCNRVKEQVLDKIQIFFEPYDENDNPIVSLFLDYDNLLKHIFSVYEILDIRVSKQSFIDIKGFLKFCVDYSIIPNISNGYQMTKIFMTYKKYETNIIDFPCFVILICCITHIGINKQGKQGFYEKLKRFMEFLQRNNNKISEKLILNKLLK